MRLARSGGYLTPQLYRSERSGHRSNPHGLHIARPCLRLMHLILGPMQIPHAHHVLPRLWLRRLQRPPWPWQAYCSDGSPPPPNQR